MPTEIDIEKLLSEEPEAEDLKEEKPTVQEESPEKKADESEKVKVLKRELRKRQEEIDKLKAPKPEEVQEEKPQGEPTIDENDPAVKAWLKKIDETASAKVKPILDAHLKRAVNRFIEKHPEYSSAEAKAKLKQCVESAEGKVEEEEILTSMSERWAAQNYKELEKAASAREHSRTATQRTATRAASVGEGIKNEDDFSEEESAKAEKLGMTAEEYRKSLASLRNNSINFTR